MKSWILAAGSSLALLACGCGGTNEGASAKDPGNVKPGEIRVPGADIAKDPGAWQGKVSSKLPDKRGEEKTQAPPLTEGLSDALGGYAFVRAKDGTCRLHLTGMDITGTCVDTGSGYRLEPAMIAGMKVEEAKNDPILKGAVKDYILTEAEGGKTLMLRLSDDKTVQFENPKNAEKPSEKGAEKKA